MRVALPGKLTLLARLFDEAGAPLYVVGGLVRNALLGVPPSDIDICSAMAPDDVAALCREWNIPCICKAPQFGTVELHLGGHAYEHTTFRSDRYDAGGAHRPAAVCFGSTIQGDAFRRDFTCNALYLNPLSGEISDPTGGLWDIYRKQIRATSEDPAIIMRDDGLRVMRLCRFACELGFSAEPATLAAAQEYAPGLSDIAWERKRDELCKILLSDIRYPSLTHGQESPVLAGLTLLYETGIFPWLLPELLEGVDVLQRPQYHAYDVFQHGLHACAAAESTLTLRLAALLHDVGKPAALREKGLPTDAGGANAKDYKLPGGVTPMLNHDTLGVPIAAKLLRRLRFPNALIADVLFLIENHMYDLNLSAKDNTLRARFSLFGYERSLQLCAMREADIRGSGLVDDFTATRWRDMLAQMKAEGAPFSPDELACTGSDLMHWLSLSPGPLIGELKMRLQLHCARYPRDNINARLMRIAKNTLSDILSSARNE